MSGSRSARLLVALAFMSFLAIVPSSMAIAQTGLDGSIGGRVVDASGGRLPGVTITLTGPALMGSHSAVTDQAGAYRFPAVPQGRDYRLEFDLSGFTRLVRQGVVVNTRAATTIDAEMVLATLTETVVVSGASPVIDTQNARQGISITKDILETVPTGRDPYSILAMSPGAVRTVPNVGGASTDQFQQTVVNGTVNRRMNLNGAESVVNNNDGRYIQYDAFEEAVVETGGASADTRRPGGGYSLELIPRSGGNQFHGGFSGFWFNESFVGDNIDDRLRADGVTSSSSTKSLYDVQGQMGGPIVKDRLWWFGAISKFRAERRVIGVDRIQLGELVPLVVNVTYQIDKRNKLQGFYAYTYKVNPNTFLSRFRRAEASLYQKPISQLRQIKWMNTLSDRSLLEVQGFQFGSDSESRPQENSGAPMADLSTGLTYNGTDGATTEQQRYQVSGSFKYFRSQGAVSHNFKIGGDWFTKRYKDAPWVGNGTDRDVRYQFQRGVPAFALIYNTPFELLRNVDGTSLYAQDQLSFGRLTVNVGARWDYYKAWWPAQGAPAGNRWESIFEPVQYPQNDDVLSWNTIAPRLSATFRMTEDGRTVVKGHYGRYPLEMDPLADTDLINPNGLRSNRYVWRGDLNGDGLLQLAELGNLVGRTVPGNNRIDPDFENPTTEEFGFTFDRELLPNMAFRAMYVHARFLNSYATTNVAIPPSAYVPTPYTDPGPDGRVGTTDDRAITVYNIQREFVGQSANVRSNYPGVQRRAHTLAFTVTKRMTENWQLIGTYTFNRVTEVRAVSNPATSPGAGVPLDFGNPNDQINQEGRALGLDAPHTFTLIGSYRLPFGIMTSGQLQVNSGFPYDRRLQILGLNQGTFSILAEATGTYRHDTRSLLDARIEKQFPMGARKVGVLVELFNLLNNNASMDSPGVLGRGTTTGGDFGRVTVIVPPRTVRLGVRYTF